MKKISLTLMLSLGLGSVSCTLNPAWLLNSSNPYNWDPGRGERPNTPEHRAYYIDWYSKLIEREACGESHPWQATGRGIFEALDDGDPNAKLYQSYIIQERRKRGLPALNFL